MNPFDPALVEAHRYAMTHHIAVHIPNTMQDVP